MNKKITLEDGVELVILNEIKHNTKTYILTDEVKDEQVQNKFNIYEKIQEGNESSIEEVTDNDLKSMLAKTLHGKLE